MNAYGILVDFRNNVKRIEIKKLMNYNIYMKKSMDLIHQATVTIPPNSEKIITFRA